MKCGLRLRLQFIQPRTGKKVNVELDANKIAIYNTGMRVIADTAKELAMSWSYDSETGITSRDTFAGSWEADLEYGALGQIDYIEVWNELAESGAGDHRGGASTSDLWEQMKHGRERTRRKDVPRAFSGVATSRFRTAHINVSEGVINFIGAIPVLDPQQKVQDFLNKAKEELLSQLWESRWGGTRNGVPRSFVRAVPNLYGDNYYSLSGRGSIFDTLSVAGMAMKSSSYGEYGGHYRVDKPYKFGRRQDKED